MTLDAGLDVRGEVALATPVGSATLTGRGGELFLDLESLAVGRALLRNPITATRAARRRVLTRLHRRLRSTGVSLALRVGERTVVEGGAGVSPNWLGHLLGLGGFRVRPAALLEALL